MKRVIDVSDTLYKACKRLVSEGAPRPSESCIANSEPYEPQETSEWVLDSDGLPICKKCEEIALQRIFVKVPHLIQDVGSRAWHQRRSEVPDEPLHHVRYRY